MFQSSLPFSSLATKDGGTVIFQSVPGGGKRSLLLYKSDAGGNPAWSRLIAVSSSVPWNGIRELDDGNIIINSNAYNGLPRSLLSSHFIVDPGGDPLWQGDYANSDQDSGVQVMNSGSPGTVIWAGTRLAANGGGVTVQYFDYGNMAERWRKNIGLTNASAIKLTPFNILLDGATVYLGGTYLNTLSGNFNGGIWLLGLDANSGAIVKAGCYQIAAPAGSSNNLVLLGPGRLMESGSNGLLMSVDLWDQTTNSKEIAFCPMDEGLKMGTPPLCLSHNFGNAAAVFSLMNSTGNAIYGVSPRAGAVYFAAVDSGKMLTRQYEVRHRFGSAANSTRYALSDKGVVVLVEPVPQGSQLSFEITGIAAGLATKNACMSIVDTNFVQATQLPVLPAALQWNMEPGLPKSTVANPPLLPSADVVVNSLVVCRETGYCQTLVISGPGEGCLNDSLIEFTATRNKECMKKIQWLAADSLLSIISAPTDSTVFVRANRPGRVYLHAFLGSCEVRDSFPLAIRGPASVKLQGDSVICAGATDTLKVVGDFYDPAWQDGSTDSMYIARAPGKFYVSARDQCKTLSADTLVVKISGCGLNRFSMPNAFTPNDDGRNDIIFPVVSGTLVHYSFSIYDRWGQQIFSSTTQGQGWDGRLKGMKQPSGTYVWICQYEFAGGQREIDKGTFLLIR